MEIKFPWDVGKHWFPVLALCPPGAAPGASVSGTTSLEWTDKLFEDDTFKDVTFKLADGEVRAHKNVLVAGSSVFAAMFSNPMKEAQTSIIDLSAVRSASMRVFLRLLYTGLVEPRDWNEPSEKVPLELLLEVAKLGKMYMVANVIDDSVEALKARLTESSPQAELDSETFQTIFSASIREDFGAVRSAAVDLSKTNPVIRLMYDGHRLHPDVQTELQGIWPLQRPAPKRARRLE